MKKLGLYYFSIILLVLLSQLTPWGQLLFQRPKFNHLQFPTKEQSFTPAIPILNPGVVPAFPASEIILQEKLFAPFVVLKGQDLSNKNLSHAHLSFADLRDTNLKGSDLSQALLYGARLEGAKFNTKTKLPFSKETARNLGMQEDL
ncbi:pentapeptide repeat-containing protein [Bdellovibrio bacteriovorus]|uniref:pentapeptide repeat-containing protein n=1 Tax=Bdellovibrio bacteriovorus TaxID=959 RepID=UPI0035A72B85